MIRRPPISTRNDTLLPYTTLFRSDPQAVAGLIGHASAGLHLAIPAHGLTQPFVDRKRRRHRLHEGLAVAQRQVETPMLLDRPARRVLHARPPENRAGPALPGTGGGGWRERWVQAG